MRTKSLPHANIFFARANTNSMETQGLHEERNCELLKFIHQNAAMGKSTMSHIADIILPSPFREEVQKQIDAYQNVLTQAEEKLDCYGEEPADISGIFKTMASSMIKMRVKQDTPPRKIARMIIEGSTKGVVEGAEKQNCYQDTDDDVQNLLKVYLDVIDNNIDSMKRYL